MRVEMSIQKIRTESANPPKAKAIEFALSKNTFLLTLLVPFVFSLISLVKWDMSSAIIVFIVVSVLTFGALAILYRTKLFLTDSKPLVHVELHNYYKELAKKNGINVDYETPGIIIDDTSKKLAFTINPSKEPCVTICDYSDIIRWERLGTKDQSIIKVRVKDLSEPLYTFWVRSEKESELWAARLASILRR